ncbi:DUF4367 domain-containing protein [Clostridium swellfunianum]|uniref:DUF4367 domain-containing protein n=1 Tax=Clostridium swellfunianum TaxID=1367462 RepID=UPI00203063CC|nr:DUF4367 domain-containing protein [Clostridium swellfunianum]MCM0647915.1 DUF4367 domain-containing protein [Clostridium swellfunianum]
MSNLKDFRNLADEIMKDINVSKELKQKTLYNIRKRRNNFILAPLFAAACVAILLIGTSIWKYSSKVLSPNNLQNPSVMNTVENSTLSTLPEGQSINPLKSTVSYELKSMEEAKQFLNDITVVPSYLPKDAVLGVIQGIIYNNENRKSLWLHFSIENNGFIINIEKKSTWKNFDGYDQTKINGTVGYIKSIEESNYRNTELRWFLDDDLYTIEGGISAEEAVKIACSLK